jgi:hypothetical protein
MPDDELHLVFANENNAPISQDLYIAGHDNLMQALDMYAYYYCYLLKINNFVPHLIAHFGETYDYSESEVLGVAHPTPNHDRNLATFDFSKAVHAQYDPLRTASKRCQLDLTKYTDPEPIHDKLSHITGQAFSRIHALRMNFTPETWDARQGYLTRDYFCARFLDNYEVEPDQMPSRMEFNFFTKSDVPLGIFEALPTVEKWMAEKRRERKFEEGIFDALQSARMGIVFPGIALREQKYPTLSCEITRSFRRDMFGIIPQEGIYIGEITNIPERNKSKPRLVYQSPR